MILKLKHRFEDSEYALHEQLKKCSVFATESKVYPTLVKLNFIETLAELLVHDNIVISTDVVLLLYFFLIFHNYLSDDLTDEKTLLEDSTGQAFELIDDIVSSFSPSSYRLQKIFLNFS